MIPRKYRPFLAIAAVLFCGTLLLYYATGPSVNRTPIHSTYSVDPKGCKALFLVMEELGLPVGRLRRPFSRLKDTGTVLIVVDPERKAPKGRELKKLEDWIRKGNRLLLFQGFHSCRGKVCKPSGKTGKSNGGRQTRCLMSLLGLSLMRVKHSTRSKVKVSIAGVPEVSSISVRVKFRWKGIPPKWHVVARDKDGLVAVERKWGKGRVIAVSDPTLPTNDRINLRGNLDFVLALVLNAPRPKRILFDEYHHGYASGESLTKYVSASVFYWLFGQLLVGAAFFFYSERARRSGRFRSLAVEKGRSSLEYVESMANILDSCSAGSVALEAILKRFLARVSRRVGARPGELDRGSRNDVKLDHTAVPEGAEHLVEECRRAIRGNFGPKEALELAQKLGEALASLDRGRGLSAGRTGGPAHRQRV